MDALSQDKVEFIISMAREVSEASLAIIDEELAEEKAPHNYSEFSMGARAEDSGVEEFASDSAYQELKSAINDMNVSEQCELVALMWLGRGTYGKSEWQNALSQARSASNDHTAEYLMRAPLLPDYLTEGLSLMTE